jgi:hypothetical protein
VELIDRQWCQSLSFVISVAVTLLNHNPQKIQ